MILDSFMSDILLYRKWNVNRQGYLVTGTCINGRKITVKMHRLIMLASDGDEVDHINGNKLDNRFENLRVVSRSQNRMNTYKPKGISQTKGVSWDSKRGKWKASIKYLGVHKTIGRFNSISEAAMAYREKEIEYFKHFARSKK